MTRADKSIDTRYNVLAALASHEYLFIIFVKRFRIITIVLPIHEKKIIVERLHHLSSWREHMDCELLNILMNCEVISANFIARFKLSPNISASRYSLSNNCMSEFSTSSARWFLILREEVNQKCVFCQFLIVSKKIVTLVPCVCINDMFPQKRFQWGLQMTIFVICTRF